MHTKMVFDLCVTGMYMQIIFSSGWITMCGYNEWQLSSTGGKCILISNVSVLSM